MKVLKLKRSDWAYFFEAFITVITVRIRFVVSSFEGLLKHYHKTDGPYKIDDEAVLNIKIALHRVRKLSLWKNQCLVYSLAARKMLSRRNIDSSLYIGVKISSETPDFGHAWLTSNELEIIESSEDHMKITEY